MCVLCVRSIHKCWSLPQYAQLYVLCVRSIHKCWLLPQYAQLYVLCVHSIHKCWSLPQYAQLYVLCVRSIHKCRSLPQYAQLYVLCVRGNPPIDHLLVQLVVVVWVSRSPNTRFDVPQSDSRHVHSRPYRHCQTKPALSDNTGTVRQHLHCQTKHTKMEPAKPTEMESLRNIGSWFCLFLKMKTLLILFCKILL